MVQSKLYERPYCDQQAILVHYAQTLYCSLRCLPNNLTSAEMAHNPIINLSIFNQTPQIYVRFTHPHQLVRRSSTSQIIVSAIPTYTKNEKSDFVILSHVGPIGLTQIPAKLFSINMAIFSPFNPKKGQKLTKCRHPRQAHPKTRNLSPMSEPYIPHPWMFFTSTPSNGFNKDMCQGISSNNYRNPPGTFQSHATLFWLKSFTKHPFHCRIAVQLFLFNFLSP